MQNLTHLALAAVGNKKPQLGCRTAISQNSYLDFALTCPVIMRDDRARITLPALGELCDIWDSLNPCLFCLCAEHLVISTACMSAQRALSSSALNLMVFQQKARCDSRFTDFTGLLVTEVSLLQLHLHDCFRGQHYCAFAVPGRCPCKLKW